MKFRKLLERIDRHSPHESFRSFVAMAACGLSNGEREDEYMTHIRRFDPQELKLMCEAFGQLILEMEENPFTDLLGDCHMEWGSQKGQKWNGEFYTPQSLCRMMAKMSAGELPEDRPIRILEPCVGSGRMVLAMAEELKERGVSPLRLDVQCWDVSALACDMAFVNLSLWGIPSLIVHGNALSMEIWHQYRTWNCFAQILDPEALKPKPPPKLQEALF